MTPDAERSAEKVVRLSDRRRVAGGTRPDRARLRSVAEVLEMPRRRGGPRSPDAA